MGSQNVNSDKGTPRLLVDLEEFLQDAKTSGDLKFYVGSSQSVFHCHSIFIKMRCPPFRDNCTEIPRKFPDLNPNLFRTFLTYIYTGKLSVEKPHVLDLLCTASTFGMDDLERTCEELLFATQLTPSSACVLLDNALKAKREQMHYGHGIQRVIDKCIGFIGENPTDCLQSSRCLAVPMETLIEIVSSDQLCLEEEEVWRFVLRWAQFQAGVETPIRHWSEEEQRRVAKFLSPVISYVRLLLIDSRIFAEEVEPTGCVPMTLLLERYRFAALPNHLGDTDPRLNPRNTPRLFQSSTILLNDRVSLARQLNDWYGHGSKQSWRCLYRASVNGFEAESFHHCCSGVAPTYVVVMLKNMNWICGGFSDVPWTRSQTPRYAASNRAFLFSYDGSTVTRFNVAKKNYAFCHDTNGGPIFGAGSDLAIASNCNMNSESYSNFPHSYEEENVSGDLGKLLTPSYNFTVAEYEVFTPASSNENETFEKD